jgi:two-component system, OmpR family, sensor histidine kinase VanS
VADLKATKGRPRMFWPLGLWRRLNIRTRLALANAGLFLAGGTALVVALTASLYHELQRPLPPGTVPGKLDPDHDRLIGLADQIRDTATSHLLHRALELLMVAVVVSALLGWWIAGRMLDRLTAITTAARHASDTTLHERLNLDGPDDELKELGDTFDSMLERLDTSFAAQRRFVANASHELRTPLTVTRTAVEVTLAKRSVTDAQWRSMAGDVARSTDRAQRLIDGLLTLARSEEQLTDVEDDDLADLAAEALDQIVAPARLRGLRIMHDLGPAPVRVNVALLGRAVANLLENAVKYNTDGGLLQVRTGATDRWSELTVSNGGALLDPAAVPELFEPFHRGEHTRGHGPTHDRDDSGTGLGLSIVHAVAHAHGGQVTARPRPGGGLQITLRLPPA